VASEADLKAAIDRGLSDAETLVTWLRDAERSYGAIAAIGGHLAECLARGGRILTCGNGGSMTDAMHFAQELSGRFRADRPALAAQAISDPSHLTCAANDYGFDRVFARGVEAWGKGGDALLVFSTSGNSPNVVAAVEAARTRGLSVVGLLGRGGGALKAACDHVVVVPGSTSDRIQEIHIKIAHLLIEQIEMRLFGTS
jgi:D-sedoheptulose 7-phosphate isomerase